jgi:hypothetical protein
MSFLEVDTDVVTVAGRQTAGTADSWQAWGGQADTALHEAATAVSEAVVTAAIQTYAADWNPKIQGVATRVDALGRNTTSAGNVVSTSDATSAVYVTTQGGVVESTGSHLTRNITV